MQQARLANSRWKYAGVLVFFVLISLGISFRDAAAAGPFAEFPGAWAGEGTITFANGSRERLRCRANYRVSGAATGLNLQLTCASDSYKFEFTGDIDATESGSISGRWTETSRNVGGTASGHTRGDSIVVLIESSAFSADMTIGTRSGRQTVALKSRAAGETASASITMRRR